MRFQRCLIILLFVLCPYPLLADRWVWTPDTGWQDMNKLPRQTPRQRYNYAVALATDGKYESAMVTFRELLAESPRNELAEGCLYYLAFCQMHIRQYWEAYQSVEELFRSYPNTKYRHAALSTEFSAGKELARLRDERALQILDAVTGHDPQGNLGAEALLEKGHFHFSQSHYVKARKAYEELVDKYPNSPYVEVALFRKAECGVKAVQQSPGNVDIARMAKSHLQDYTAKYPKGQWAERSHLYAEAIEKLAATTDANERAFYEALIGYYEGRYEDVYWRFRRLAAWWLRGSELGEQSQFYYADCLAHMGQTYTAFKAFEQLFAKYGTGMMARRAIERELALARDLAKTHPKRAIWAYGQVVAHDPTGPLAADAQIEMANTYFVQKDYWNAKTAYQTLLTAYPTSAWAPLALFRAGVCALEYAREVNVPTVYLEEAQTKFEEYLERYPEGANVDEARGKLKEIADMKAQQLFEVAKWYLSRGKHEAAAIYLQSLLKDEYKNAKCIPEARNILNKLRPSMAEQTAKEGPGS